MLPRLRVAHAMDGFLASVARLKQRGTMSCLQRLDAVSYELCLVGDAASAIAHLHPTPTLRDEARALALRLGAIVQDVNVSSDLAHELASEPAPDDEGRIVRAALLDEFTWDGAFLADDGARAHVSALQNEIRELEWTLKDDASMDLLVVKRHALASALGFDSYAQLATSKLSLGTPDNVAAFLQRACDALAPYRASTEISLKHSPPPLELTVDAAVDGLTCLAARTFGLTLTRVPEPSYHPTVVELVVSDQAGARLGTLGLDLVPRPGKTAGTALYPLRSRLSSRPDDAAACIVALDLVPNHSGLCALLHEFGHALQQLSSVTAYQHLSGARGPLDLVEVPSLLLERLAWEPAVAALFAPGAAGLDSLVEARRVVHVRDLAAQVKLAQLDLELFGPSPRPFSDVWPAALSGAVSHLAGPYGGGYHAYVFAHCLAGELWTKAFASDAFGPGGKALVAGALRKGGTARVDDFATSVDVKRMLA